MSSPGDNSPLVRLGGHRVKERARQQLDAARGRYEGSWVQAFVAQLKALHVFDWTTIFGAELLWSALPFIILLSSLANERIDDDLSRHIGLDSQGAHIVEQLFRHSPAHATIAIVTGLLFSFAGSIAVVSSLQLLYERVFGQQHRARDFLRLIIWVAVFLAAAVAEGVIGGPVRAVAGHVAQGLLGFVVVTVLFGWTMHFLLAGRVPWRLVIRPALVSGLLWVALAVFSSIYFSPTVIDDSKTYGTIGVVFTFLTWFMLIGFVIVLGAAGGAVWQQRTRRDALSADSRRAADQSDGHGNSAHSFPETPTT
jgi:membrane protein